MKKLFLLPILLLSLISTPCLSETTKDDLVIRDGLFYKKFTDTLFTGKVTGKMEVRVVEGKAEGDWIFYHENGNLKYKMSINNGKPEGETIGYHENGQLSEKGSYKNGKREGEWVGYRENGLLSSKGSYKNDKMEGEWVMYYKNGTAVKEYTGTFKDGKKVSD
jgi:antitoxin component YwqK of YwqJK toxin-antitoxin module